MPICFTQLILHDGDRLYMALLLPLRRPRCPQVLSIGNFNICNGREFGLTQSTQVVQISRLDLMILTETNITYQSY